MLLSKKSPLFALERTKTEKTTPKKSFTPESKPLHKLGTVFTKFLVMRNYSVFYSPSFLLLFVALSLMWSCEQEAALQDFEAVPDEMEIAAKKAPPGGAALTPPCSGCRPTVNSMTRNDATIEIQSILAGQLFDLPVPAYVCNSNVLRLSGMASAANLPATIEFEEVNQVDLKKLQFRARTLNVPSVGFTYTISCSGSSTFGGITSNSTTWFPQPPQIATATATPGWDFRFPASNTNSSYDCVLASVCDDEEAPLEP